MTEILKDYGPAIGPALAFLLGLLALYFKYLFDRASERWTVVRRMDHLQKLVGTMSPPPDYFPRSAIGGIIHADEARNLTNLARFYSRLLALRSVVESVGESVAESGSKDQIVRFHSAKWWFDILVKTVEKRRETEDFKLSSADHADLLRQWQQFVETVSGEDQMGYIRYAP